MVKHALREGSTRCCQSERLCQAKRLSDWQEGGQVCQWSALNWLLGLHLATALRQALIDTADDLTWALDLHQKDRLLETGLSGKLGGVHGSAGRWNDLVTASVGVVLMGHDIHNVVACASLVLVRENTFFGDPLEASLD